MRDSKSTEESSVQRQVWLRFSITPSIPQLQAFQSKRKTPEMSWEPGPCHHKCHRVQVHLLMQDGAAWDQSNFSTELQNARWYQSPMTIGGEDGFRTIDFSSLPERRMHIQSPSPEQVSCNQHKQNAAERSSPSWPCLYTVVPRAYSNGTAASHKECRNPSDACSNKIIFLSHAEHQGSPDERRNEVWHQARAEASRAA